MTRSGGNGVGGRNPIAVVLGTRPEIIKMAPVLDALISIGMEAAVVHTNQHYTAELDSVFFRDLGLAPPTVNLEVGSAGHGVQTGRMLERLEPVLQRLGTRVVLVEGDTNSVLAGVLTAVKLGITVGHVEAGLRSGDRSMPEELNRIAADHLADHLYAPTPEAVANLGREGLAGERVLLTGNTIVDACRRNVRRAEPEVLLERRRLSAGGYLLLTLHRQENTDRSERLASIIEGVVKAAEATGLPLVFPVHPRTVKALTESGLNTRLEQSEAVCTTEPLGYLEFLGLLVGAAAVLSDSGGVQEEACILGVPCVTLRDNTERPETVEVAANRLVGADTERIVQATREALSTSCSWSQPFGDGRSGLRIAEHAASLLG